MLNQTSVERISAFAKAGWRRVQITQIGFTLIELMVVLVIVGVLAVISFSQYESVTEKVKGDGARNVLELMLQAERIYRLSEGTYVDCHLPPTDCSTVLNLALPSGDWDYEVDVDPINPDEFDITATRLGGSFAYNTRTIIIDEDGNLDAVSTWPFF